MEKSLKNVASWEKNRELVAKASPADETKKIQRLISRIIVAVFAVAMIILGVLGASKPVIVAEGVTVSGKEVNFISVLIAVINNGKNTSAVAENQVKGQIPTSMIFIMVASFMYLLVVIPVAIKMFVDIKRDRECAFTTDVIIIVFGSIFMMFLNIVNAAVFGIEVKEVDKTFLQNFFNGPVELAEAKLFIKQGEMLTWGTLVFTIAIFGVGLFNVFTREKGFIGKYQHFDVSTLIYFIALFVLTVISFILLMCVSAEQWGKALESLFNKSVGGSLVGEGEKVKQMAVIAAVMAVGVFGTVCGFVVLTVIAVKDVLFYGTANAAFLEQAKEYRTASARLIDIILTVICSVTAAVTSSILRSKYNVSIDFNGLMIGIAICGAALFVSWILFIKKKIIT